MPNKPIFQSLPNWARWCAKDADGVWWCYEAEPHLHDHGWYENEVGRSQKIVLHTELSDAVRWQDSLTQVDSGANSGNPKI